MKIQPFNRQVSVFLRDIKDPRKRSARLAAVAKEGIADIRKKNNAALGHDPEPRVYVDGREGAPIDGVRPDGVIVANFNPMLALLEWIGEQLVLASPRLTGRYERSHVLEIDGKRWDNIGPMPDGEIYMFFNDTPYARKIEPRQRVFSEFEDAQGRTVRGSGKVRGGRRGWRKRSKTDVGQSDQAPEGVYAAVAVTADTRFGNIARVSYSLRNWREGETGLSHPAIIVRPY